MFFGNDFFLVSIGMNEKRAKAAGIEYSVWTEYFKGNDRSLADRGRSRQN